MEHARDIASQLTSFEVARVHYRAKLDQNESPVEPPPQIREAFLEAAGEIPWNRYPDDEEMGAAHSALAGYLGVTPNSVLAAAGSDALILFILSVFGGPGRKVLLFPPHYPIYSSFALLSSTEIVSLPLGSGFQPDLEKLRPYLDSANILIIANPNNPTGNLIDEEIIEEFLSHENLLVVLDEAYYEFSGKTHIEDLDKHPNLIILRTFSKAIGLAGLRFGYCAARPDYIEYIRRAIFPPYNLTKAQGALAEIVIENMEATRPIIEQTYTQRDQQLSA
ncbi:MAG: aminotransferase class I/II-fold pyridoxal phosphate-dependent enzyme, partial [bacterium]|nr:aminotransferase class I/II-fold pyridoxal phosphate-dependent enzyme [bacterium]